MIVLSKEKIKLFQSTISYTFIMKPLSPIYADDRELSMVLSNSPNTALSLGF